MKILMLVNWKVKKCDQVPEGIQPPDYVVKGKPYWFFRYFKDQPEVDVVDISSFPFLEGFEKDKLRFYVIQTLKVLFRLNRYDLILSHGMQSGVVVSLIRRLFPTRSRHVVFDIGSFNSAAETGGALKLMQAASKSIDGLIYHTSSQINYYRKCFPWIGDRSVFIPFGTDPDFFQGRKASEDGKEYAWKVREGGNKTILCVGYAKRDWDTLYRAFHLLRSDIRLKEEERASLELKFIGREEYSPLGEGVVCSPYIPVDSLIREMEQAAFCVLPLKEFNYSFGQMTLLQQMAMGKAVITSRVSSMVDYVEDGVTGLLYEPENERDLWEKMYQLVRDAAYCEGLGRKAGRSVEGFYNEKRMAGEIEKCLKQFRA